MSWSEKIRRKTAAGVQLTMDGENIHLSMASVPVTAVGVAPWPRQWRAW